MTLPTPTPPDWLYDAIGGDHPSDIASQIVRAVWDALTSEGSIWWSDTGDRESNNLMLANRHWNSRCEPVLVVPLARHNPNQDAT